MKLRSIFLFFFFVCSSMLPVIATAQFNDPASANPFNDPSPSSTASDPGDLPPAPTDTPIDGGLSILIGAGVALGYKKFKANRKLHKIEVVENVK